MIGTVNRGHNGIVFGFNGPRQLVGTVYVALGCLTPLHPRANAAAMIPATAMNFRSRWVLVTGASSGLGREIARDLALRHRANLVIAARRLSRLQALADELQQAAGVEVVPLAADLSREGDVENLFAQATEGRDIYAVVLNAGVTHFGEQTELEWPQFKAMLATNVTSLVHLVHLFLPYLLETGHEGGIMLVASLAGLIPVPFQSAYSGTKGFVINFGQGLWHETRDLPVSVTTFAPGGISTEMVDTTGLSKYFKHGSAGMMPADVCARKAVDGFAARKYMCVPGALNRLAILMSSVLPRKLVSGMLAGEYRKALAARDAS